jgi:hypothetical protein
VYSPGAPAGRMHSTGHTGTQLESLQQLRVITKAMAAPSAIPVISRAMGLTAAAINETASRSSMPSGERGYTARVKRVVHE